MGKFLKILRYIANLIAIMGKCFSKEEQDGRRSNLTRPLLDGQTKGYDFNSDQGVSSIRLPNSPEVEAFLSSHVNKPNGEFWETETQIISQTVNKFLKCVVLNGYGPIPPLLEDTKNRTVMSLKLVSFTSLIDTNIHRTDDGFVIDIGEKSFKLTNFDLLLKQEIFDGNFKEDLVDENPEDYKQIWDVLTSGGSFVALYY
jgi:hypothetical protein